MSRSFDQAVFRQKLYNWVVRTDQAFRVTEEPSFKDLIKYCSSSARIVGGDTIKRDLMENFALNRAALSEELSVRKSSRYSYYGFLTQPAEIGMSSIRDIGYVEIKCKQGLHGYYRSLH